MQNRRVHDGSRGDAETLCLKVYVDRFQYQATKIMLLK